MAKYITIKDLSKIIGFSYKHVQIFTGHYTLNKFIEKRRLSCRICECFLLVDESIAQLDNYLKRKNRYNSEDIAILRDMI